MKKQPFFSPKIPLAMTVAVLASFSTGFAQKSSVTPEAQPVHILVGKSVIINVQSRLKRVLVSNPTVIEAMATSPTQIVVEGLAAGESSLILWDEAGYTRMLDVRVDLDLTGLRDAIEEAYPNSSIQAQADQGRIILSGTVEGQPVVDDLTKMAGVYSKDIVNSLAIAQPLQRQILLKVRFIEIDRTKLRQLGINIFSTGATNTIGTVSTQEFGPLAGSSGSPLNLNDTLTQPAPNSRSTTTTFGLTNLLNIFLFRPDIHLGATIENLEQKNILQILAEPNLLALDGAKASFLAGGEFPYPIVQGGVNIGAVTIQFRPFGVQLQFIGHILPHDVIQLQVEPEVSTLDYSNAITLSGFTIPAFSTRRAETEIELRNGQSFGIAGLLDQTATVQLSKIPGIGDIPILGQLFRSRNIKKDRTELFVLVTPYIANPVKTGQQMASSVPKAPVPFLKKEKYDQTLPGHKESQPPSRSKSSQKKP